MMTSTRATRLPRSGQDVGAVGAGARRSAETTSHGRESAPKAARSPGGDTFLLPLGRCASTTNTKTGTLVLWWDFQGEISAGDLPDSERAKPYIYALDPQGRPFSPSWSTLGARLEHQWSPPPHFGLRFGEHHQSEIQDLFVWDQRPGQECFAAVGLEDLSPVYPWKCVFFGLFITQNTRP